MIWSCFVQLKIVLSIALHLSILFSIFFYFSFKFSDISIWKFKWKTIENQTKNICWFHKVCEHIFRSKIAMIITCEYFDSYSFQRNFVFFFHFLLTFFCFNYSIYLIFPSFFWISSSFSIIIIKEITSDFIIFVESSAPEIHEQTIC